MQQLLRLMHCGETQREASLVVWCEHSYDEDFFAQQNICHFMGIWRVEGQEAEVRVVPNVVSEVRQKPFIVAKQSYTVHVFGDYGILAKAAKIHAMIDVGA